MNKLRTVISQPKIPVAHTIQFIKKESLQSKESETSKTHVKKLSLAAKAFPRLRGKTHLPAFTTYFLLRSGTETITEKHPAKPKTAGKTT